MRLIVVAVLSVLFCVADGEANAAVVELLCEVLRVKRRCCSIVKGHKSRLKVLAISDGGLTVAEAITVLQLAAAAAGQER